MPAPFPVARISALLNYPVAVVTILVVLGALLPTRSQAASEGARCPSYFAFGSERPTRILRFYTDPVEPLNHPRWSALKRILSDAGPDLQLRLYPAYANEELSESERYLRIEVSRLLARETPASVFAGLARTGPQRVLAQRPAQDHTAHADLARECIDQVLLANLRSAEAGLALAGESVFPVFAIELAVGTSDKGTHSKLNRIDWFEAAGDPRARDVQVRLQAQVEPAESDADELAHLTDFRQRRAELAPGLRTPFESRFHPTLSRGARHHLAFAVDEHAEPRTLARSLRPILQYIRHHPGELSLQLLLPPTGNLMAERTNEACSAMTAGAVARLFERWATYPQPPEPRNEALRAGEARCAELPSEPEPTALLPRGHARLSGGGRAWLDGRAIGPLDLDELELVIARLERQQSVFRLLWSMPLSSLDNVGVPR